MPIEFTTATNGDDLADRATALANRLDATVADLLGMLAELDRLEVDVDATAQAANVTDQDYEVQLDLLGLGAAGRCRDAVSRLVRALDD